MNKLIQWPKAKYWTAQWNPIIGCKPCSPACEHCYAAAWAKRFGQSFEPHLSKGPRRPPRKGIVFCGNMTDIFYESIAFSDQAFYIGKAVAYLGKRYDATYLWLTKRPSRMCDVLQKAVVYPQQSERLYAKFSENFLRDCDMGNHYFGFTAENQEWYDKRFRESCQLPHWANWWISAEPLLGSIDLGLSDRHPVTGAFGVIPHPPSWLVVGCESGPNRRPCKIEWVESIVEQCLAANVPVFVKQICLPNGKFTNKIEEFPKHLQIRQVPWAKESQTNNN